MAATQSILALDLVSHDARLTATESVDATPDLPAHLRVRGVVEDDIGFEIRCPVSDWNHKLLFGGEGGFAGTIGGPGSPSGIGLRRGYAEVYSDTGHKGEMLGGFSEVYDGRWAWQQPRRVENWAHRSTHVVLPVAREIVHAAFGEPVRRAYFMGCSGGGRQAAMVAQRYPQDFDGIVSDCPWLNLTGQVLLWIHAAQALARQPFSPGRLTSLRDAAHRAFGEPDAGYISDPLTPACGVDWLGDADSGLTMEELALVRAIYGGAAERGLPGYLPGGEDTIWPDALVDVGSGGPSQRLVLLPDNFLKYFALGPARGIGDFDFGTDVRAVTRFADLLDVKPDLTAFERAGGKLVMIHGCNDIRISPLFTIDFRDRVIAAFGGEEDRVEGFFRLFLVAGSGHCGGGPGPNEYDGLSAIEKWVEEGIAPRELMSVARRPDGSVTGTSHTRSFRWSNHRRHATQTPPGHRGAALA